MIRFSQGGFPSRRNHYLGTASGADNFRAIPDFGTHTHTQPPALGSGVGSGVWGLGWGLGSGVWGVLGENGFFTIGPQNGDLDALLPANDSYGRPASFWCS